MSPRFEESIAGQDGHLGALYHAASVLIDEFGLMKAEAWGPMWEYNTTKAHPPESEYQINHKLDDAIKNHPRPSLRALENDRPKSNEHPNASSNGTNGHANALRFRTLIEGEILGFGDRDNFGRVVQDMGNGGLITFRGGPGRGSHQAASY